jgi:hypothetical protein
VSEESHTTSLFSLSFCSSKTYLLVLSCKYSDEYESPLLEVITVRPEDEGLRFSEELGSSTVGSSDEEMEIIANFIENVEVRDKYSTSEGSPPSSLRNMSFTDEGSYRSPLQVVQRRGDFNARMQQTRGMVEHQGTVVSRKGHLHRRERSII